MAEKRNKEDGVNWRRIADMEEDRIKKAVEEDKTNDGGKWKRMEENRKEDNMKFREHGGE